MPRLIVLADFEGEVRLNGPLEMQSNAVGPMPFDGNANTGGWLKEKDKVENFMSDFCSDSGNEWGINEEFLPPNF